MLQQTFVKEVSEFIQIYTNRAATILTIIDDIDYTNSSNFIVIYTNTMYTYFCNSNTLQETMGAVSPILSAKIALSTNKEECCNSSHSSPKNRLK